MPGIWGASGCFKDMSVLFEFILFPAIRITFITFLNRCFKTKKKRINRKRGSCLLMQDRESGAGSTGAV